MRRLPNFCPRGVLTSIALLSCSPSVSSGPSASPAHVTERETAHIASGNIALEGEYAFPPHATRPTPLVVFVHGSGASDRDGVGRDGCCNTYGLLAEGFAAHGIASFRYDKRGFAKSAPDISPEARAVPYLVDDVVAVVARLRRDPRVGKITLLGHSEGSEIAFLAARRARPDAVLSVGGAGRPILEVLRAQLATQVDAPTVASFERLIADVQAGKALRDVPEVLQPLFAERSIPWLRSTLDLVPTDIARGTTVPTCIARGEYDAQIAAEDTALLARALPSARVISLPRTSHLLKAETSPTLPQASYSEPQRPLADGVIAALAPCIAR